MQEGQTGTTVAHQRKKNEGEGATGRQNEQLDPGSYCLFVLVRVWRDWNHCSAFLHFHVYVYPRMCVCVCGYKGIGGWHPL